MTTSERPVPVASADTDDELAGNTARLTDFLRFSRLVKMENLLDV
jgi:hypothetical protein